MDVDSDVLLLFSIHDMVVYELSKFDDINRKLNEITADNESVLHGVRLKYNDHVDRFYQHQKDARTREKYYNDVKKFKKYLREHDLSSHTKVKTNLHETISLLSIPQDMIKYFAAIGGDYRSYESGGWKFYGINGLKYYKNFYNIHKTIRSNLYNLPRYKPDENIQYYKPSDWMTFCEEKIRIKEKYIGFCNIIVYYVINLNPKSDCYQHVYVIKQQPDTKYSTDHASDFELTHEFGSFASFLEHHIHRYCKDKAGDFTKSAKKINTHS